MSLENVADFMAERNGLYVNFTAITRILRLYYAANVHSITRVCTM